MPYLCKPCNYTTDDQSNFNKHQLTVRHQRRCDEEKQKYKCALCGKTYTSNSNLSRHIKFCKMSMIDNVKNEYEIKLKEQDKLHNDMIINVIKEKDNIIVEKDMLIVQLTANNDKLKDTLELVQENKKETLDILAAENNFHKQQLNTASRSMSALTYVMENYPNAPPLKEFDKFELLQIEANKSIVETTLYQYKTKTLAASIGDVIIKHYKTNDPAQQSLWNTDGSRFAYIYREIVDNKVQWTVDKGGVKIQKLAIKPILKYIEKEMRKYMYDRADDLDDPDQIDKAGEISEELQNVSKIIDIILNGALAKDIFHHITKMLYLNRKAEIETEQNMINETDEKNKQRMLMDKTDKEKPTTQPTREPAKEKSTKQKSTKQKLTKQKSTKQPTKQKPTKKIQNEVFDTFEDICSENDDTICDKEPQISARKTGLEGKYDSGDELLSDDEEPYKLRDIPIDEMEEVRRRAKLYPRKRRNYKYTY